MKPLILFLCLFLFGCGSGGGSSPEPMAVFGISPTPPQKPNILLIISDDQGVDASAQYPYSMDVPTTPTLDALAEQGITFDTVWATAACTTTRGSIITGMHGINSGITEIPYIDDEDPVMHESTYTLQEHVRALDTSYQTAVIGKWHLADYAKDGQIEGDLMHPVNSGVGHYAGGPLAGMIYDYFNWDLIQDGIATPTTEYHTTKTTDLAIDWMGAQGDAPWFLWVAYAAPHAPVHLPPYDLHDRDYLNDGAYPRQLNRREYYLAAIEAMDTEIGRLLDSLPAEERENTVIIYVGDNGTPSWGIDTAVFDEFKSKVSLYEGGVRVPMVVSGRGVTRVGEREEAMINTTDIYATIAQIILPTEPTITNDAFSFKHLLDNLGTGERAFNYTEYQRDDTIAGWKGSGWAVRNNQYKLIQFTEGTQELYRVEDMKEEYNLIADENHTYGSVLGELEAYATRIRDGKGNGP